MYDFILVFNHYYCVSVEVLSLSYQNLKTLCEPKYYSKHATLSCISNVLAMHDQSVSVPNFECVAVSMSKNGRRAKIYNIYKWLMCQSPDLLGYAYLSSVSIFVISDHKDFKFDVQFECASHSLWTTNCSWYGRGQVMWPIKILGTPIISLERLNLKSSQILYTGRLYQFLQHDDISPTKRVMVTWLF